MPKTLEGRTKVLLVLPVDDHSRVHVSRLLAGGRPRGSRRNTVQMRAVPLPRRSKQTGELCPRQHAVSEVGSGMRPLFISSSWTTHSNPSHMQDFVKKVCLDTKVQGVKVNGALEIYPFQYSKECDIRVRVSHRCGTPSLINAYRRPAGRNSIPPFRSTGTPLRIPPRDHTHIQGIRVQETSKRHPLQRNATRHVARS